MSNLNKLKLANWSSKFVFVNFIIALVISLRYLGPHELVDGFSGNIYLITYAIGQIGLLALLIAFSIKILNLLINIPILNKALSILLVGVSLAFLLADTFVYQQYRFHFNGMVFELMVEGGTEIFSFSLLLWLKIASIVIAFIAAQIFISEYIWRKQSTMTLHLKPVITTWFICLLFSHSFNIWADAMFEKQITKQAHYFPLSYPTTAKSLMAKFGIMNIEAQKQQALLKQKKAKTELIYPINSMQCEASTKPKNIIVIVFDSWRNDMIGDKITPNIAKLAATSNTLTNHYSGSNNTRHGMFSLFYGIPGHYWQPILDRQTSPILMDTLQQQEYQMGIFSSAKLTSPEFDQTIFRGIRDLRTHSVGEKPFERDIDLTKDFIDWHKNRDTAKPYFSFMLFDAAHGFSIPKDYPKVYQPSLDEADYMALDDDYNAEPFVNLYKNAVHFMDAQVAQVIAEIGDELDNTIIIITGDHGKEFNESQKGYWGHNSNYSDYQTRVPLIIHWPKAKAELFNGQTSHYDIAPTLLSAELGCSNSSTDYSIGQSLFNKTADDYLLLGRDGYYAIKDGEQLNELDRLGNFSIYDTKYQDLPNAKLDMKKVLSAMDELRRFYK